MLHDSAANNELPDATRIVDEATVQITDVAETVVRNYGICQENSTTLSSLQDWVREQSGIR